MFDLVASYLPFFEGEAPPAELQLFNAIMNGGAFGAIVLAIVVVIKQTPKLLTRVIEQHDKMLSTFASNQEKDRLASDTRYREIVTEMRQDTMMLVAEMKAGHDQQSQLLRDLAERNYDAIKTSKSRREPRDPK